MSRLWTADFELIAVLTKLTRQVCGYRLMERFALRAMPDDHPAPPCIGPMWNPRKRTCIRPGADHLFAPLAGTPHNLNLAEQEPAMTQHRGLLLWAVYDFNTQSHIVRS